MLNQFKSIQNQILHAHLDDHRTHGANKRNVGFFYQSISIMARPLHHTKAQIHV